MSEVNQRTRLWLFAGGGLLIAFGIPELELGRRLASGDSLNARLIREAFWWGLGAAMLTYVVFVEHRPLSSIGIRRPTATTFLIAVAAAMLMLATVALSYAVIFPLLKLTVNRVALATITHNPVWLIVLMVARAGVVEEILYRGYPIERLQEVSGSKWLAASVPTVVFIFAHLSGWGPEQLIVVFFGALLLALLYLWRRDLICNMAAHFLVDLAGFLASPAG